MTQARPDKHTAESPPPATKYLLREISTSTNQVAGVTAGARTTTVNKATEEDEGEGKQRHRQAGTQHGTCTTRTADRAAKRHLGNGTWPWAGQLGDGESSWEKI